MQPTIALQLYTLRNPLADDLAGTLRKAKEAGYMHVEIGPFSHTMEEIAAKSREVGLTPFSTHEMALADVATAKATVELAGECGVKFLIVEQDDHWIDGDPFKSIRISLENLKKMME